MNLPFFSFFGKKEKKQYFLTLLLYEEKVTALVFEEFLGKIKILGRREEYFDTSSEEATLDEWLEVLDKAISTAENAISSNIETQKTLFGIQKNWTEDSKIKKEHLVKLKKITDTLGLLPIGFLIIPEAIAHLLKEEEGAPVSAILVEVDKKNIFVSILRAGRLLETKKTRIEDSVSQTVDRILHHFTSYEVLPSRIIIFDGKDNEKLSQEFIAHSWSKSLPFLHVPQITVLSTDFDTKAVIFGAATQMGFEVLEKEKEVEKDSKEEAPAISEKEALTSDFGFLEGQDIVLSSRKETPPPQEQPIASPIDTAQESKSRFLTVRDFALSLVKDAVSFLARLPIPSIPRGRKIILIPPLIIGFFLFLLLLYIFGLRSTIILTLDPKIIEQDQEVVFSTVSKTDAVKQTVSAEFVSTSQDGSVTVPATGKKEVGDKAKGKITILSSIAKEQTFAQGTVVTSSNSLAFTLNESVKVASSSGLSDLKSVQVEVTAKDIGKEYNLPSGTKFTVGSFESSEVEAKNDVAFSGGTKKEVTVVSKDDINKLTEEIIKNLTEKAKDETARKISSEKSVLPIFLSTTLTKKDFSKDAGDEASSLTLKAT
ncbi:MAG: baseplate J/gp47 family protein, partial [bacterium]|nr:baseplate J/gp47 family protein [bacterium]